MTAAASSGALQSLSQSRVPISRSKGTRHVGTRTEGTGALPREVAKPDTASSRESPIGISIGAWPRLLTTSAQRGSLLDRIFSIVPSEA